MRFERITDTGHQMYKKALELYAISFPRHEQREPASQAAIMCDRDYCFYLLYDEASFVGLLLCWETDGFIYIEHLCISPDMRNRHYGEKALTLLGHSGKTVILEIDPPVDAIAIRRREFYRRNGFVENLYAHTHPPYHRGNTGHSLMLMTFPAVIAPEEYNFFDNYLTFRVMAGAFVVDDAPNPY